MTYLAQPLLYGTVAWLRAVESWAMVTVAGLAAVVSRERWAWV